PPTFTSFEMVIRKISSSSAMQLADPTACPSGSLITTSCDPEVSEKGPSPNTLISNSGASRTDGELSLDSAMNRRKTVLVGSSAGGMVWKTSVGIVNGKAVLFK